MRCGGLFVRSEFCSAEKGGHPAISLEVVELPKFAKIVLIPPRKFPGSSSSEILSLGNFITLKRSPGNMGWGLVGGLFEVPSPLVEVYLSCSSPSCSRIC